MRRVLRDLAKGVRNPESLPTAQLRNLAAVHHGPMAALFSLNPADEALVERLLGEPEEEDAVNPFEVDSGSSRAPEDESQAEEQGYSHGADAARLRQIEEQLRAYEMEHQWTEGGELADFNFRSSCAAAVVGEQGECQGSSQSVAAASGDDGGGVSASSSIVVNNRTREQAEYYAAAKLVTGAMGGGGGDGDVHLAAAREARAAAEAAEAVDRRLRALQTSALPVRMSAAAMAALVSECKAQQEASSSRAPASPPKVEPEEDTAAAAAAATESGGDDGRAAARAEAREARAGKAAVAAAAAAEARRERRASGRAERKAERTVVEEDRERAEGGKVQESTADRKAEDRGVGLSAKAKARAAERSALAAAGGGKVVRSERPSSSSSDSGRSRELRPTSTPSPSSTSTTPRAERENRPVAASTANLPRPDLGLSNTRCACGRTLSSVGCADSNAPSIQRSPESASETRTVGWVGCGQRGGIDRSAHLEVGRAAQQRQATAERASDGVRLHRRPHHRHHLTERRGGLQTGVRRAPASPAVLRIVRQCSRQCPSFGVVVHTTAERRACGGWGQSPLRDHVGGGARRSTHRGLETGEVWRVYII